MLASMCSCICVLFWTSLKADLCYSENADVCGGLPTSFNVSVGAEERARFNTQCHWDTEGELLLKPALLPAMIIACNLTLTTFSL
jgi:hypothetical protein